MTWRNTTREHLGWAWKSGEASVQVTYRLSPPSFTSASYQHLPPSFSSNLGTSSSTFFHTNSLHPLVAPDLLSFSHLSSCDYVICWFFSPKRLSAQLLTKQPLVPHSSSSATSSKDSCDPSLLLQLSSLSPLPSFRAIRALLPSWACSAAQE